jgi:adenylate cyclase
VLVHANVIENLLREDYVRVFPPWIVWSGGLVFSLAGLASFSKRRPIEQAFFALALPVAFLAAATLAWINGSWIVPIVGPLLGFALVQLVMIGRRMLAEMRAKEQIKGMFGTYVSPELVNRLVSAGKPPELGGHEKEITAYFSDIESFSTFSEVLSPPQLVELMNEYLTACTDIVQEGGGTLDKYIGDAIVAMYGAPVELSDHAYRACLSVVRVQERIEELRAKWTRDGQWPEMVQRLRTRIGLNTGSCVIGNMGSRTRFNYTMMGDNVNLAARMESGAKQWGTYAMCTEATRQACRAQAGDRIVFRPLGRIRVKGRSQAVPIFEIAGRQDSVSAAARECFAAFEEGLAHYYVREWSRAEALFQKSALFEPLIPGKHAGVHSNPSLKYLDLIKEMRAASLPPDWDGVYAMKEK